MRISIALATYNGDRYLDNQLNSFSRQTLLPDELIVSDDDSSDSTISILEAYAKEAQFEVIIFKNKSNLGYSKNFENAIRNCTGDLIFLSDQDDLWFPQKIEHMADRFALESDLHLLACNVEFADESLHPTGKTKMENYPSLGIPLEKYVPGCASAFRRELLDIYLPVPDCWNYDDWLHVLGNLLNVRGLDHEPLQFYRRHGDNASVTSFNQINIASRASRLWEELKNVSGTRNAVTLEHEKIRALIERVSQSGIINSYGPERISTDLRRLDESLANHRERIEILNRPKSTRWFFSFSFLIRGGYNEFRNTFSFINDSFLN